VTHELEKMHEEYALVPADKACNFMYIAFVCVTH
jgi:hypothetical protein